jgi:hypothetical protein
MEEMTHKVAKTTEQKLATPKLQKDKDKKSKKEEDFIDFGIKDYKEYLKIRKLDFIGDLIVGVEETAKAIIETEEMRKIERERVEELAREEIKLKERLDSLKYRRGTWNVKIINILREISNEITADAPEINPADSSQYIDDSSLSNYATESRKSSQDRQPTSESVSKSGIQQTFVNPADSFQYIDDSLLSNYASESRKSSPDRRTTSVNKSGIQQKFEVIWKNLKMPLDQRMDMAIKHGSHRSSSSSIVGFFYLFLEILISMADCIRAYSPARTDFNRHIQI